MQKKSIYVAYTGGTIGMQRSANGCIPVSGHLQQQLANMPEFHRPEMPDFTIHEYVPLIDSSDMTPADWQAIAKDIQQHYDEYDGFVILHGSDTMAFTASALSLWRIWQNRSLLQGHKFRWPNCVLMGKPTCLMRSMSRLITR